MMSEPREIHTQVVEQFGRDSAAAKLDYSLSNTRPYSRYYLLQGTGGCFDLRTWLFIKGVGKESSPGYGTWEPVGESLERDRHPYWRKDAATARQTGRHDGMDYFCLREFVDMVRYDREPWVDCYDAAADNALNQCSEKSIDARGAPVEIPDFTKGKQKDPDWRKDRPGPAAVIPA